MKSDVGKRVLILDPLRGLAACSVMWSHFTSGGAFLQGSAPGYAELRASGYYGGGWGVFAFFVISGFVLPYSLQYAGYRPADFGRFVYKRLLRLEPPYLVALALTVGLLVVAQYAPGFQGPPFQVEWHRLALHLAYLNAWSEYPWYNEAFWTLAIEFQFYLALGVLFPLVVHPRLAVRAMVPWRSAHFRSPRPKSRCRIRCTSCTFPWAIA